MAKRSQRCSLWYEKDQGGCISGFMNIFDFRHGRSTKKLLVDRKRGRRQAGLRTCDIRPTVTESNEKCHNTKEAGKSEKATDDGVKTSVKKLKEAEMIHEQVAEKQNVSREASENSNPENGNGSKRHHMRRSRTYSRSMDMDTYDGESLRNMEPGNLSQRMIDQRNPDNIDLEILIKELRQIHHRYIDLANSDLNIDCDMQSDQVQNVQEKLHAAIKVFISQSLTSNRYSKEDGGNHHSKELKDALQTINSNKELFLKLLQEPNSLLVTHIKGFEGVPLTTDQKFNSLPRSNFLEEVPTMSGPDEPVSLKHRKFFRRRSKSQDNFSFGGDDTHQSSSNIVILKPGTAGSTAPGNEDNTSTSLQSRCSFENKVQGDKHAFNFSLAVIKRRLKHAVGKERQISNSNNTLYGSSSEDQNKGETETGPGGDNLGWSSPNRNHFYTEKIAKPNISFWRGDKNGRLKDIDAAIINDPSVYPNPGVSNIYAEATKHLSELLNGGEVDSKLITGQLPKSLGRILSLPEYKDSQWSSPEETEGNFVTAKHRLSPRVNGTTNQHTQEKLDGHISSSKPTIDGETHEIGENGKVPDVNYHASSEVIFENSLEENTFKGERNSEIDKTTIRDIEGNESSNVLEISCASSQVFENVQSDIAAELIEEYQESSSPPASLSFSSVGIKVKDSETGVEKTDRPSPISVLEPLFLEGDISPARTIQQELKILPRKIQFKEQSCFSEEGISIINSLEDGESPFEYVEAVLLGSGLNWDEFLLRWVSLQQILDQSLFEEVELFSSRRHDQKLLFDCTNEVLKEVCDCYFGGSIGISSSRQSIQPAPRGMNLIHEIWEGIEQHLVHHPPPKSLDQFVKVDMTKFGMWVKPHMDIEDIGIGMEEAIFEELVEDAVACFIDDSLGLLSADSPDGSHEIEISFDSLFNLPPTSPSI